MLTLKKNKNDRSYKFGRWLLIILSLASIPLDTQKAYEEIQKSKIYLNKSMLDTINYHSATVSIHFIGLVSALEHEIWLTISCRLLTAFIYHFELNSRTNETLPNDPEEMQRVLRDKYPPNFQTKQRSSKRTKKRSTNGPQIVKPTKYNPKRSTSKKPIKKNTATKKP